jgi:site-specific DNA-cytosine methylase
MNILSLFDGISCAYESLKKSSIKVKYYYASEIDVNAIIVSKLNHPEIIQLGDVTQIDGNFLKKIDLLIGGSPCQDLSISKKDRKGLEGNKSSLFWEYVRLKNECNPQYFILENVASMSRKDKDVITEALGVEPVLFNASLVSGQCRKRYFWTNIKFELPQDKGITLKDVLQPNTEVDDRFVTKEGKSFCLTSSYSKVSNSPAQIEHNSKKKQRTMVKENDSIRKLTPIECERLQGLSDDYTKDIAVTNRYKALGNAFNVDVVAHILKHI